MGKSSSKLSAESIESRFKQLTSSQTGDQSSNVQDCQSSSFHERNLRSWCKGFNKDFPNAQLTFILDNEHLLAPFLTDIFYQEVEVSDSMQTLFRGNCLASKIMSHCFRTFGSTYLKQLLEPHIKPLIKTDSNVMGSDKDSAFHSPAHTSSSLTNTTSTTDANDDETTNKDNNAQDMQQDQNDIVKSDSNTHKSVSSTKSYEIDSKRLEGDDDIDANQKNLLKLTKQILDSILSSAADFPPQLNSMCICLRQVLCKKYPNPEANLKAVGTVIFLRFINPAIVSPYEAGIISQPPPPRIMRGLMLVSKILQNIANNVEFSKEEHMLPFNDFVRTQFGPMRQWVSEISSEHDGEDDNDRGDSQQQTGGQIASV